MSEIEPIYIANCYKFQLIRYFSLSHMSESTVSTKWWLVVFLILPLTHRTDEGAHLRERVSDSKAFWTLYSRVALVVR
jgi:predicted secreted protein